jgi:hypothetical protein
VSFAESSHQQALQTHSAYNKWNLTLQQSL